MIHKCCLLCPVVLQGAEVCEQQKVIGVLGRPPNNYRN